MRLSDFIREHRAEIIEQWQVFASSLRPVGQLSQLQLRNHVEEILDFIADDVATAQSAEQQFEKAQGHSDASSGKDTAAQIHAALRHKDGFDIVEMISEYRALRASVSALWTHCVGELSQLQSADLGRFHEAIDQALAESVQRFAKDVDDTKNLLLGVLGHDIRSPVSAIQMAADLIPRVQAIGPHQQALLDQITESSKRVQHIVSDLIDLAKSNSGQNLPLKKRPCCLSTLCDKVINELEVQFPLREFSFIGPSKLTGNWDEVRLGQVLTNLLNNAVQYGSADRPIIVTLSDKGCDVMVAVKNEGKPIPSSHLQSIFHSFTRVSKVGVEDGVPTPNLGLGLFITNEIVTAHGGAIDVTSTRDFGTTFSMRLPKGEFMPA